MPRFASLISRHHRASGRRLPWLAGALGALLALAWTENPRLTDALNYAFPAQLDPRILVVGIDDASLKDYGRLDIWPRELYAQAISTLQQAGVKVIALDVLLGDSTGRDASLRQALNRPNVVLASAPDDLPPPDELQAQQGISALNSRFGLPVREFQTAYATTRELLPSFARQVAQQSGLNVPLDTSPRLLRYVPTEQLRERTLSFRDLVNEDVRFADLQGKTVLLGLTASGLSGQQLPDLGSRQTPGVYLQARAVNSLMQAPIRVPPLWANALLGLLAAYLAARWRAPGGFALAALSLLLAIPLWWAGIAFLGVTVSFAALLGTLLSGLELWWQRRKQLTRDALTGFGNRLAFTRMVEHRWATRQARPISLILVDLADLRQIIEREGRLVGDELLRELGQRLQKAKRRHDLIFRWGPDEFALLLGNTGLAELEKVTQQLRRALSGLSHQGRPLVAHLGGASSQEASTPTDLIELASRQRYRRQQEVGGPGSGQRVKA